MGDCVELLSNDVILYSFPIDVCCMILMAQLINIEVR